MDDLRSGAPVVPTRGASRVCSFKAVSRVLAGFHDGLADEGVGAGPASLEDLKIAQAAKTQGNDRGDGDSASGDGDRDSASGDGKAQK